METVPDPGQTIDEMDQGKSLEEKSTLNSIATTASGILPVPEKAKPTTLKATKSDIEESAVVHVLPLHKKVIALRTLLESDIHAADIKWSLFVAACQHYRWDSCLKPFPIDFIKDGNKDIESLLLVVNNMSNLKILNKYLQDDETHGAESKIIDLAYWVMCRSKDVRIMSVTKQNHASVMARVPCEAAATKPNWIFQVRSRVTGSNEHLWKQATLGKNKMFAYHGSRLENFYSILHHGLQQHLNKNSLFGQGVYLSSELSVSLPYSPMGYSWGGSMIGSQLSCVALCEMLDHPDVKCQDKDAGRSRAITRDSVGGEVPNKYYVVRNSDLVRVRYLLVYAKKHGEIDHPRMCWGMPGWLRQHKLLAVFFAYAVMLIAVGLSNNVQVLRFGKTLRKNVETAINKYMKK